MTDCELTTLESQLCDVIRRRSAPMSPMPTHVQPVLQPLPSIQAVLFDLYGTLFISGSGDVGTTDIGSKPRAFPEALAAVGLEFSGDGANGVQVLSDTIAAHHKSSRISGIEYPEVDIREVWADVIKHLTNQGCLRTLENTDQPTNTTLLALEYEVRTNPVWPMHSAVDLLHQLRDADLQMAIVSNAQCFTPLLFPTLMRETLDELGFREEWCQWSYQHRQAKPGTFMFERAREAVAAAGISANEVLYVGNDRLKDVWPAARVGFRTALFSGDSRSYRPREGLEQISGVNPDLVITDLAQLPDCLAGS